MCVNIANGEVSLAGTDFSLPGPVPFVLSRSYSSRSKPAGSLLGNWNENLRIELTRQPEQYVLTGLESGPMTFSIDSALAESAVDQADPLYQSVLQRVGDRIVISRRSDGASMEFHPSARSPVIWNLRSREDAWGNAIRYGYDRHDRLISYTDFRDRELRLVYNAAGLLEEVELVGATKREKPTRLVSYEYDQELNLVAVRDALRASTHYEYVDGLIVRQVNPLGGETFFAYDHQRRCIHTWQTDGRRSRRLQFHPAQKLTVLTDSFGHRSVYRFNEADLPIERIDPLGNVKYTAYDDKNAVLSSNDEEAGDGQMTYYDPNRRELILMDLTGATSIERLDAEGRALERVDANGATWKLEYNERGLLTSRRSPLDAQWQFQYDPRGFLSAITNPLGNRISIDRSSDQSQMVQSDSLGILRRVHYDVFGRVTKEINAIGGETVYQYDAMGREHLVTAPDGSWVMLERDPAGNIVRTTDSLGRSWVSQFDRYGNLLVTGTPAGHRLTSRYDLEGRLESVTNETGEQSRFEYDAAGRCVEVTFFDGSRQRLEIDFATGDSAWILADGHAIQDECDPAGRVTARSYPDGTIGQFDFDPSGRLLRAEWPTASVEYAWDEEGRVAQEVQKTAKIAYKYNPVGNLIEVHFQDRHIRYEHNARGQFTRVLDSAAGEFRFRHDISQRTVMMHGPSGIDTTSRYDVAGRLVERRVERAGKTCHGRTYEYDQVGRLVFIHEQPGDRHIQLKYDVQDRVTFVLLNDRKLAEYAYDDRGNMTRSPRVSRAQYGRGNHLESTDHGKVRCDAAGRVTDLPSAKSSRRCTYGYEGELLSVAVGDDELVEFTYDPLLRRVTKESPLGTTNYVWINDLPWREIRPEDTVDHVYLGVGGDCLAKVIDGRLFHAVTDHLGNTIALLHDDGSLAWRCLFPYLAEDAQEVPCDARFAGQQFDEETGLALNRYRYFDPDTHRFLSPDPVPFLQGANTYIYVDNDFMNQSDPLGLAGCYDPECDRLFKEMDNFVNTTNEKAPGTNQSQMNAPHPNNAPINGNMNAHFRGMKERAADLARNRGQQPLRRLPGDPLGQRQTIMSHRQIYQQQQVALQRRVADWDAAGCQPKNTSDPTRAGKVQQDAREWAVREAPPIRHVGDPNRMWGKVTIWSPPGR